MKGDTTGYGLIASWVDDRLRNPEASEAIHELESMLADAGVDGRLPSHEAIRELEDRCRALGLLDDAEGGRADERVYYVVVELIDAVERIGSARKPRLVADTYLRAIRTTIEDDSF